MGGGAVSGPPSPWISSRRVKPVDPFVLAIRLGTTRDHERIPTALPKCRGAPAPSYLGHTPRVERFNHLVDQARHRLPAGSSTPSQVSDGRCRLRHVARGRYPSGAVPTCNPPGSPQFPRGPIPTISKPRNEKLASTHGTTLFAAWQRLAIDLPASPLRAFHG